MKETDSHHSVHLRKKNSDGQKLLTQEHLGEDPWNNGSYRFSDPRSRYLTKRKLISSKMKDKFKSQWLDYETEGSAIKRLVVNHKASKNVKELEGSEFPSLSVSGFSMRSHLFAQSPRRFRESLGNICNCIQQQW